ncbi:MAG TPA: DUF87 domain-containing protein [Candidatus Micrarchaeia archaeon]|nr:DUF87 domain-containing protein [Candidatus Micrarchaeia archaeon]
MQLLVTARRLRPQQASGAAPDAPLAERLRQDRLRHIVRSLGDRPAFVRQVHLVVAVPDRASAAAATAAADGLQRTGMEVERCDPEAMTPPGAELVESVHHLRAQATWLASIRVTRLPGRPVEPGWLWELVGLEAEQDLSLYVSPRPARTALRQLERAHRIVDTARLAGAAPGLDDDPRLAAGALAIRTLRRRLAADEVRAFDCAITTTLAAASPAEVARLIDAQVARVRGLLGEARAATFEQARARRDTLARGVPPAEGLRLVDTDALSTCWPWVDAGRPPGAGALLGRHRRTGALCQLDLFDTRRRANANCGILAASGGGKSYLAGLLLLEDLSRGIASVIVDPEGEHRELCHSAGGRYLELGGPHGASLNVFELGDADEAVVLAAEVTGAMCGGLSELERARVEVAAREAIAAAAPGPATLTDCRLALLERWPTDRVAILLERWVDGRAGRCFSRPSSSDEPGPLTGIGLAECPPEWLPAATLVVAGWLWALVRRDPRPRHVILDEAGLLLEHLPLRRLLVQLARRIRKYEGSLVFVTQNVGDLLGSAAGEVLAGNAATLLLGSQHGHDAARLQTALSLTAAQRAAIEECRRGEFLLVSADERTPVVVQAPPLHHAILEARRRTRPM